MLRSFSRLASTGWAARRFAQTTAQSLDSPLVIKPDFRRPRCFLDFSLEGFPAGSVVIELKSDIVPKAAENFRCLCTGEKGDHLSYKNTRMNLMVLGVCMAGGDVHHNLGQQGGESIYGRFFEDENFIVPHEYGGVIGMINCGEPHTNGSQFYITIGPAPFMDGRHVAFGQVIEGIDVVKKIVRVAGNPEVRQGIAMSQVTSCKRTVLVESCGELTGSNYAIYGE